MVNADLRALLARVEAATGQNEAYDRIGYDTCVALLGRDRGHAFLYNLAGPHVQNPATSVDAALSLIGEVLPDADFELHYRGAKLRSVKWYDPANNWWRVYEKPLALIAALISAKIAEKHGSSSAGGGE